MLVRSRSFDTAHSDFEKMWRFLQKDYVQKQDRFIWHFSRLGDWKYGLWNERKYIPSLFRNHAQLWVDGFDQILGFVLSEDGDDLFFIFTLHGYEHLYTEILEWTIQHWQPRHGKLRAEVHEHQTEALAALERKGFHNSGAAATTRLYDLLAQENKEIKLGPGFQMVDMVKNGDYRAKATLNLNAFGDQDQVSAFDLLRFEYSRESPAYDPYLDLSVVTSDGRHVSSCVGFWDPACKVAEIEKICTHNQYRRQGLAEAVIRECFRRLRKHGIQRAYITGYSEEANGLYEKLGPSMHKKWFHYELKA